MQVDLTRRPCVPFIHRPNGAVLQDPPVPPGQGQGVRRGGGSTGTPFPLTTPASPSLPFTPGTPLRGPSPLVPLEGCYVNKQDRALGNLREWAFLPDRRRCGVIEAVSGYLGVWGFFVAASH